MTVKEENFELVTETERLVIRPLKNTDYENWYKEFSNRYPSKHRHDQGKMDMSECTKDWFEGLVHKHRKLAHADTAYVFGVFRKEDGTHLGMVDFSTLEREDFQWGRLGYSIHNQYWGMGYGKEAVRKGLTIGFNDLKFHRLEAHINLDNEASINLAKSVGLKYECTREKFIFEFGEWTDNLIYYKNSIK
ncbi:GNAT family N-acetyltransferase [Halalkalibacillus halophilus]|uniref:GNAT family N-acetyltransferase n=1 Tax=Halalkalibacillus halophilus TaxID=392827 RepID=UPI00040C07FB|nr:GNAT family N-acetyltransferase [Halalkalibacillus halophilus]